MGVFAFPNLNLTVDTGGFPLLSFWPDGPNHSIVELPLMGWKNEPDYPPEYWDALMSSSMVITDEDLSLLDTIQASLNSGCLKGVPLGYTEKGIYWYHEEIDRIIGVDKIPDILRVRQVLGLHVTE